MTVICIIQARLGSTRLPGKVLADLGGKPVLAWVVRACQAATGVDEVWVATTTKEEDSKITSWGAENNVSVICGSEDDVLSRFVETWEAAKRPEIILRVTGDEPFIDPAVISGVVRLQKQTGADYCSNIHPRTFADGLDVECFTAKALLAANQEATRAIDRDTVTYWLMRNRSRFPSETLINSIPGQEKERYVLDTTQDLDFCRAIAAAHPWEKGPPSQYDILTILDGAPELKNINSNHIMNERFFESLGSETHYERKFSHSHQQFEKAIKTIPFGAQTFSKSHLQYPEGGPLFLSHGEGGYAYDIDGQEYVDLVSALLPNILGYNDADINHAIRRQLNSGISFSLATELEAKLAEKLVEHIPCAEMVKFGKNGADVTAAAVRLSRAITKRPKIMLLENGYHGWHDWSIASTVRNLGATDHGLTVRAKPDLDWIAGRLKRRTFAALILEPEGHSATYLGALKKLCEATDTILVFDEVITGFRWSLGGYQKYIGVTPDLATFGKAMANGMPLSAIVGGTGLMRRFQPPNNAFYSGTFFGETLSLAASLATIQKIERENVISRLWAAGWALHDKVNDLIAGHGLQDDISLYGDGPRIHIKAAPETMTLLRKELIADGVLIISSHNICYAHGKPEIDRAVLAYDRALEKIKCELASSQAQSSALVVGVR